MWWQLELVADVVAALTGVRDVHRQHQRLVAEGLHAVHGLFRQLAVPVQIQLEPAVTVWCSGYDLLHGAGGVGAGDVAGVERFCGCEDDDKGRFVIFLAVSAPMSTLCCYICMHRFSPRAVAISPSCQARQ